MSIARGMEDTVRRHEPWIRTRASVIQPALRVLSFSPPHRARRGAAL